jgi:hypothetical protein
MKWTLLILDVVISGLIGLYVFHLTDDALVTICCSFGSLFLVTIALFHVHAHDDVAAISSSDLDDLQATHTLQASVFEVSAELVSCIDERDARRRFISAIRTWWTGTTLELFVWTRGSWIALGTGNNDQPPVLKGPVHLPDDSQGDLILDLSTAVKGQAILVLQNARPQPSLRKFCADNLPYPCDE